MKTTSLFPLNKISTMAKLAAMATVVSLSACGGGSDSTSTTTTMQFTGTAALGKALSGASVVVTCKSGTGSATSNADGSFSVSITNGTGPCMLTATLGNTVLHSFAPGAGVVNVTPLTDMLVSYLATEAGTPATNLLANANGIAIMSSAATIAAAETAIATTLAKGASLLSGTNVTLSSTNFLTQPLVAGSSANDTDLENLLAAGYISSTGVVSPTVTTSLTTTAAKTPFVAPTGATGAQ